MREELSDFYKITESDAKYISKLYERAFFNWSLAVALEPEDEIRRIKAHYFYEVSIRHIIKKGEAYASSPNMEGVAMWVHSDHYEMSTWQMIKNGGLKALYKLGIKKMMKGAKAIEFAENLTSEIMGEPHYHLVWLGVEPELQRKGIGTELMNVLLKKFANENMKCFLDTQDEQNIEYYERFGFKTIKERKFPNIDVTYWGMLWEPKSSQLENNKS
jgi:ribosomal protein S18 acetylase RimI-like enzyme